MLDIVLIYHVLHVPGSEALKINVNKAWSDPEDTHGLEQWFTECGPRPLSAASPGNLLDRQILRLHPDLLSQKLGDPAICFNKPSRWLVPAEVWKPLDWLLAALRWPSIKQWLTKVLNAWQYVGCWVLWKRRPNAPKKLTVYSREQDTCLL